MPTAKDPEAEQAPELKAVKEMSLKKDSEVPEEPPAALPRTRRKRHYFLWTLFILLMAAFFWLATSSNPFAQGIQEFVGNKHDQAILDTPFSISSHNFRYYKFTLPEGSTNVAIVGDFSSSVEPENRKHDAKTQAGAADQGIEVYVLSESAFAIWQTGYATSSIFESGRVLEGKVQGDLPAGAGVYYLVFSNKFASQTSKRITATVLLHYKSWLPDWLRRMKSDS